MPFVGRTRFEEVQNEFAKQVQTLVSTEDKAMIRSLTERYYWNQIGVDMEFDEQHSRPQRYGSQAPFATCTFIDQISKKIIYQCHVDSAACDKINVKCKAKASRNIGLKYLAINLPKFSHVTSDKCSGAIKSINDLKKNNIKFKDVLHHYDIWHIQKSLGTKFSTLRSQRLKKYGPYTFPHLQKIDIGKLKKHFQYSASNADGDELQFAVTWMGFADHVVEKGLIPIESNDYKALVQFLDGYLLSAKNISYGKSTANCESFHAVANKYCRKGIKQTFTMYCGRKGLARMVWNWEKTEVGSSIDKKKKTIQLILQAILNTKLNQ